MAAADKETHASSVRPRSYQDESYLHGFLGAVGDLQKDGALQDVVLEVEDRRFPCHRLVLSAASPYFRAMFTSDMAESRQKTVVLQGLDADIFGDILSYIYSGTLHVSLDRVQHLYQAADLLQLDYVRDTCSSYMAMNVERSTCVDLYKFADAFSVRSVLKRCLQYIFKHFPEVSSSEEFCSLSVDQLTEIISQDKLDVKEETRVWEAVVRWVQHSTEDRLQHLPSILPHIRFNLLTSDDTTAILEHPLIMEDHGSSEVVRNRVQRRDPNLKPRLGMTMEMALVPHEETEEMLWMNPAEGKYIRCRYNVFAYMGIVTGDNDIYALADDSYKITLHKYNHVENKWELKSTVHEEPLDPDNMRYNEYLLEIDGQLFYLLVTWPREMSVVTLKKYNQHTNKWHNCSTPEHHGRLDFVVAVCCNQQIYLLTEKEIHWYDAKDDQWTGKTLSDYSPEMKGLFCSAVVMGTEIFCMEYFFKRTLVYNTEADSWIELPAPKISQDIGIENSTLFVLKNKLYALLNCGDYSSPVGCRQVQHVYMYDRSEAVWRESSILSDPHWLTNDPAYPVARIYLPYLNSRHAGDTQGAENPDGQRGE